MYHGQTECLRKKTKQNIFKAQVIPKVKAVVGL